MVTGQHRIHAALLRVISRSVGTRYAEYAKAPPSADETQRFGEFAKLVLGMVHTHHGTEEEVIFPLYSKRIPEHAHIDDLVAEHRQLLTTARWTRPPSRRPAPPCRTRPGGRPRPRTPLP
jgi:hypothetical protein